MVSANERPSMEAAARFEILLLFKLIMDAFATRLYKYSVLKCGLYMVFLKLRYNEDLNTRTVLHHWEVQVDGLLSSPNCPVFVRQAWIGFKDVMRTRVKNLFGGPVVVKE